MMVDRGESVKSSCETVGVSRSGWYRRGGFGKRCTGCVEDDRLVGRLVELRELHPFWGYRRMAAWLRHREGLWVNRKRVYRLMRERGLLVERKRYRAVRTPQRSKPRAARPNEYWGIDMTKFFIGGLGWCYLIVVLDWFTKELVGWKVSLRARAQEWKEALDGALCEKFPLGARGEGLSLVSDNGSQPTSVGFMRDAALLGVNQIFCSYDNPRGNAETERVIRTVKEELLWLNEFSSFEEACEGIGNWIRNDYNQLYVHSSIGYRSPEEFREAWDESEGLRAELGVC